MKNNFKNFGIAILFMFAMSVIAIILIETLT
jgi:hypothetical protein